MEFCFCDCGQHHKIGQPVEMQIIKYEFCAPLSLSVSLALSLSFVVLLFGQHSFVNCMRFHIHYSNILWSFGRISFFFFVSFGWPLFFVAFVVCAKSHRHIFYLSMCVYDSKVVNIYPTHHQKTAMH